MTKKIKSSTNFAASKVKRMHVGEDGGCFQASVDHVLTKNLGRPGGHDLR
jgi:hypothetical protein